MGKRLKQMVQIRYVYVKMHNITNHQGNEFKGDSSEWLKLKRSTV